VAFRQGKELAEGQKSMEVKHEMPLATPLRPPTQLAEGVEFPEKNADFCSLALSFGGRGPKTSYLQFLSF
jgi:hypothetical protein